MSKRALDAIVVGIQKYQELKKSSFVGTPGKVYREYSHRAPHRVILSIKSMAEELTELITSEVGLNLKTISGSKIYNMAKTMHDNIVQAATAMGYKYDKATNEILVDGFENNYDAVSRLFARAYGQDNKKAYGPVFDFIIQELQKSSAYSDEVRYIEDFKVANPDPTKHKIGFDVGHVESNISSTIKATIWNTLRTNEKFTDLLSLSDEERAKIEEELSTVENDFLKIVNNPVASNQLYDYLKSLSVIKSPEEFGSLLKDFGTVTFSFIRRIVNGQIHADLKIETTIKDIRDLQHIAEQAYAVVKPEFSKYNQLKGAKIEKALAKQFEKDSNAFFTTFKLWAAGKYQIPGMPSLPQSEGSPTIEEMAADEIYTRIKYGTATQANYLGATKRSGKGKVNKTTGIKIKVIPPQKGTLTKKSVPGVQPFRNSSGRFISLVNVVNLINLQLGEKIRQNMGSPRLNYRTGRFAQSAQVLPASVDKDGAIRLPYTYLKSPYQTFEVGYSKGTPSRDPRVVISESIRELAVRQVAAKLRIVRV